MKCRAWKNWRGYWKKFRFDGEGVDSEKTDGSENVAVSGCCFGMHDHLSSSVLLLKPASEGEKLAVAQTVSPSDTNAKIRNRKMVGLPAKAAGHSDVFCPVLFLPSSTRTPQNSRYSEINTAVNQLLSAKPYI